MRKKISRKGAKRAKKIYFFTCFRLADLQGITQIKKFRVHSRLFACIILEILQKKTEASYESRSRFKSKEKNYEDEVCFSIGLNRSRATLISIYNAPPCFCAGRLY